MTRFAAPSVHACPGCATFFLRSQLSIVNYWGAQDWSDATPTMWWHQEPLVRCHSCATLFWMQDAESVGIMPATPGTIGPITRRWLRWRGDPGGHLQDQEAWSQATRLWGNAQYIGSVNFDDVAYVLARSKGLSHDRILWLRNRIWWGLNDRYRIRSDGSPIPDVPMWPVAVERTNMEVILDMLQDSDAEPWHTIQRGELLRLLGRFDEAITILKAVPPDGHSEVRAIKIEQLARSGNAQVRLLNKP